MGTIANVQWSIPDKRCRLTSCPSKTQNHRCILQIPELHFVFQCFLFFAEIIRMYMKSFYLTTRHDCASSERLSFTPQFDFKSSKLTDYQFLPKCCEVIFSPKCEFQCSNVSKFYALFIYNYNSKLCQIVCLLGRIL